MNNDTICVLENQYKVIYNKGIELDVEITDISLLNVLREEIQPVILIEIEKKYFIAKGNDIVSSSTPINCDFFYPLSGDKIFFNKKNILNLTKTTKATQ